MPKLILKALEGDCRVLIDPTDSYGHFIIYFGLATVTVSIQITCRKHQLTCSGWALYVCILPLGKMLSSFV